MIDKYEARRIQVEIRRVLMDVWDPIGVRDAITTRDEYDSYIGKVYAMLAGRASDEEIAKQLLCIERELLGIPHPGLSISPTIAALRTIKLPARSE